MGGFQQSILDSLQSAGFQNMAFSQLNQLTPEQIASYVGRIDADTHRYVPELTKRVHEFLFFKKIEFDEAMNRWDIEANSGGCL